ncbi:activator-dependent family glycosyltransferase [Streptosporangium sp. NPDC002544]|uniref:activator-dependent family glycosyltransferase n=1 Tax=Streptosporangium sp. NPDC002544 TaxID=3154538 RepID=UPI00332C28B2
MRVLFAVNPGNSTFHPLVPLAWALRTAGHEVRVASQPAFAETITQAGLTAVPVGRDLDIIRLFQIYGLTAEQLEAARVGLPSPYDVAADPANATWRRMLDGYVDTVGGYNAENVPMIAGLVDFARRWQPDLIIWEPFTYAGPIAAKACGAAHARLLWSVDVFGIAREHFLRLKTEQPAHERADPLADWLGSYARKYGFAFDEDMTTGHFTIDQLPASLTAQADLPYVPMRYVPYGGPAVVPKWLSVPPERPRVALTLGLTATELFDGYALDTQDVLDSLGDLDVEVVATIAESEQEKLTRVPRNARLVPYVPLHALAPTCDVVVNHAGPGTALTTALHAIPQLALGYHFDEPILARRLAARGGALEIPYERATGRDIREAVLRLLAEPSFREGARDLRDEMHATPTPNQLVPHLEELTAKHRTAPR